MAHYPAEDQRRLHEGRADLAAGGDPALLGGDATLQAALLHVQGLYRGALERLEAAVGAALRERAESDAARAQLEEARQHLLRTWRFVQRRAREALLNPDPDAPALTAAEATRRERLLAQAFPVTTSTLSDAAFADAITHAQAAQRALQAIPELASLNLHERLAPVTEAFSAAVAAWSAEAREDRAATEAVWSARAELDTAQAAYADQLRVVLRLQGRLPELGRWLRAEDPAYKARRRARVPISEEPPLEG